MDVGLDCEINVEKSSILYLFVQKFFITFRNIFFKDRGVSIDGELDKGDFAGFNEFTLDNPRDGTEKFMKVF